MIAGQAIGFHEVNEAITLKTGQATEGSEPETLLAIFKDVLHVVARQSVAHGEARYLPVAVSEQPVLVPNQMLPSELSRITKMGSRYDPAR